MTNTSTNPKQINLSLIHLSATGCSITSHIKEMKANLFSFFTLTAFFSSAKNPNDEKYLELLRFWGWSTVCLGSLLAVLRVYIWEGSGSHIGMLGIGHSCVRKITLFNREVVGFLFGFAQFTPGSTQRNDSLRGPYGVLEIGQLWWWCQT